MKPICIFIAILFFMDAGEIVAATNEPSVDGTISGHVYDADTRQPISQAWVYCQEISSSKAITDIEGYYAIKGGFSPSKGHKIECTRYGYKSTSNDVTTDQSGKAEANFYLKPEDLSPKENLSNVGTDLPSISKDQIAVDFMGQNEGLPNSLRDSTDYQKGVIEGLSRGWFMAQRYDQAQKGSPNAYNQAILLYNEWITRIFGYNESLMLNKLVPIGT
jgi:hypothetical protein